MLSAGIKDSSLENISFISKVHDLENCRYEQLIPTEAASPEKIQDLTPMLILSGLLPGILLPQKMEPVSFIPPRHLVQMILK